MPLGWMTLEMLASAMVMGSMSIWARVVLAGSQVSRLVFSKPVA
ncbi:hypothetical protein [Chromohalobacter sp. 296-RDG]|nr:hypothetical protein [Chromohalobacter sp. 296-RDG]